MELVTKDLLINFLFILMPLFLMQMVYLFKYTYRLEKIKKASFMFFVLLSIILCMFFPFSLGSGFTWDLRRVPFLLGILYGGPLYGSWLFAILLFVRYLIGGDGFLVTLYSYLPITIFTIFLSKYYLKMSLKKKLVTSGLLVFVSTWLTYLSTVQSVNLSLTTSMWIQYFAFNTIGMLVVTAVMEFIKTNFELLERLIKAEKLEVVSNLAASISHEVRNPLTASKGFMQLSYERDLPPETKQYIRMSIEELDRATEIINDYLTFAKPATEKKEHTLVYKSIQHAVNVLTPLANIRNVEIELILEEQKHRFIPGESKKIEQALINVIKNGIESMPKGGKLQICLDYDLQTVHINICDQGKGMTQEQINRLGEPYFTTKESGTGLGMMVSFSIIQKAGGEIKVKSEINRGTCFSIKFPVFNI